MIGSARSIADEIRVGHSHVTPNDTESVSEIGEKFSSRNSRKGNAERAAGYGSELLQRADGRTRSTSELINGGTRERWWQPRFCGERKCSTRMWTASSRHPQSRGKHPMSSRATIQLGQHKLRLLGREMCHFRAEERSETADRSVCDAGLQNSAPQLRRDSRSIAAARRKDHRPSQRENAGLPLVLRL